MTHLCVNACLQVVVYNHMKLQAIRARVAAQAKGSDEEKAAGANGSLVPHTER